MNVTLKALTVALVFLSSWVQATTSGIYVGYKYGTPTLDGALSSFNEDNISGFLGGYAFDSGFAIEAEQLSFDATSPAGASGSGDTITLTTDILAIYGVSRIGDTAYLKVKGGYLTEDVSNSVTAAKTSDSGLSYGLGLGVEVKHFMAELEYTMIEAEVSAVTLAVGFKF